MRRIPVFVSFYGDAWLAASYVSPQAVDGVPPRPCEVVLGDEPYLGGNLYYEYEDLEDDWSDL